MLPAGRMCHSAVPAPGRAQDAPDELQGRVPGEYSRVRVATPTWAACTPPSHRANGKQAGPSPSAAHPLPPCPEGVRVWEPLRTSGPFPSPSGRPPLRPGDSQTGTTGLLQGEGCPSGQGFRPRPNTFLEAWPPARRPFHGRGFLRGGLSPRSSLPGLPPALSFPTRRAWCQLASASCLTPCSPSCFWNSFASTSVSECPPDPASAAPPPPMCLLLPWAQPSLGIRGPLSSLPGQSATFQQLRGGRNQVADGGPS